MLDEQEAAKHRDDIEFYEVETKQGTFKFAQAPRGVVPALLEDLAQFRKRAKADMAVAKKRGDEWAAAVHNGKQLAYKVTMNSVYGFLGATKGRLPCVPIAASVTATGRQMIEQTKRLVEAMVPGSRVIYGDTDSVMVIFELGPERRHDMRAHFQVAARVAADVSATFKAPNELEFEKCYYPYVLYSKKHYAGERVFFVCLFLRRCSEHEQHRAAAGPAPRCCFSGCCRWLRGLPLHSARADGTVLSPDQPQQF